MAALLAGLGGQYASLANQHAATTQTLVGLVDLHTHPAAHLGFGTELFYGPPDGDMSVGFNDCNGFHGSWGTGNSEGNIIRNAAVNKITAEGYPGTWADTYAGYPDFPTWPTWHDRLHQQVRVEMLERAWQGGLRVIVALAVNSHTLAMVGQTRGNYDDLSVGDTQIAFTREMVASQPFMELALAPQDVRQIVGSGKLAVVLGVELDCIGNFYLAKNTDHAGAAFQPAPSEDEIRAEVQRLYGLGVRYFFPVHLVDNVFGGTALYEMDFDIASRYQFGAWYAAETAPASSQIDFAISPATSFWQQVLTSPFGAGETLIEQVSLGFDPTQWPTPPPPPHRNSRGLQPQGQVMLNELMRLGAMIDVDHMGENTVQGTLQYTGQWDYPLFAGHNGIRSLPGGTERSHLLAVAAQILERGGMFGVGIKGGMQFLAKTIAQLRGATAAGGIAMGSDSSGLEQLPAPRAGSKVVYSDEPNAPAGALQRCHLGNRAEDINAAGFAHVGMYPDFIEDGVGSGLLSAAALAELLNGPEAFVTAWEKCLEHRAPSTGTVPNVVGLMQSDAVAKIQAAGFTCTAQLDPEPVGAPQHVEAQSPVGGTVAPLGSAVTITVVIHRMPLPDPPVPAKGYRP